MRKISAIALSVLLSLMLILASCGNDEAPDSSNVIGGVEINLADTSGMDFSFDEEDVNGDYDLNNAVDIDLGNDGTVIDDATVPETLTPETSTPETSTPETSTPGTSTPETSTPETATPGRSTRKA